MRKILATGLSLCLVLSGCTVTRSADGTGGEEGTQAPVINQIALGGRAFQVYELLADPAYPAKMGPRTVFDYIKANFGPQN